MSDQNQQLAVQRPLVKASSELSISLGMEVPMMIDAIKSQAFKGKRPDEISDAQLATYISTANALKLNPLLPGQMYAYPDRQGGGITVMIGPDGVFTLLSNNENVVAQKDGGAAWWTEHGKDADGKDTCTGYVNHRVKGLMKKTIWVDEWVVGNNPNWAARRHHMAEIRALKQVARMVINGMPVDSDERQISEMVNVTESMNDGAPDAAAQAPAPIRADPPARKRKGVNAAPEAGAPAQQPAIEAEVVDIKTGASVTSEAQAEAPKAEAAPATGAPITTGGTASPIVAPGSGAAPAPADAPSGPRAFLKDGEIVSVTATATDAKGLMLKESDGQMTPSLSLSLSGGFVGVAYFKGAGTPNGAEVDTPADWKSVRNGTFKLRGKANPRGKVNVFVDGFTPLGGATAEEV